MKNLRASTSKCKIQMSQSLPLTSPQIYIDYTDTYSPVLNVNALIMFFALAIKKNMFIMQYDIKTAFLYGELKEYILMKLPHSFDSKICKLNK